MNTVYQSVALESIRESASNPRQHFDEKGMAELTESIRTKGVVSPLLLRPMEGFYELVDGARRYRAAKAAGLETVPAILRHMSDEDALEIQVIANLQRQDVHALDEAEGYKRLLDTKRYDVAALAAKVGKSASYIYQRLALNELIPAGKKAFWGGELLQSHAQLIARLQAADQKEMLRGCIDLNWSISDLRREIETDVMCHLDKAGFDKKDPLLVHKAGACTVCPKRSGFNKELFEDMTKADRCMDPSCFHAKVTAHIKRVENQAKESKTKLLRLSGKSWSNEKGVIAKAGDWAESDGWRAPKKGCPDTSKGVIVEGDGVGRVMDVCTNRGCKVCNPGGKKSTSSSSQGETTTEDRHERRMEIWNGRVEQAFRQRLYDELLPTIGGPVTREHLIMILHALTGYGYDTLSAIAAKLGTSFGEEHLDGHGEWCNALEKATTAQIFQMVMGMIVRNELISDPSYPGDGDAEEMRVLHGLHAMASVDLDEIRAAVTAELEPKKPKPPKVEKAPAGKKAKKEVKDDE